MGQDKTMWGGDEDPTLRPRHTPLPSLLRTDVAYKIILKNYNKPKKNDTLPKKYIKIRKTQKQNKINSSIKSKKEKNPHEIFFLSLSCQLITQIHPKQNNL